MKFEDFALLPRVIERAKRLVSCEDALYYYSWRTDSTTNSVLIQRDILKAYYILEDDSFADRNPIAIKIYFIRQVMGSLLWAMMQVDGNLNEVRSIMDHSSEKFPDLIELMKDEYIGKYKQTWGKLLIKGHYSLASAYCRFYENAKHGLKLILKR